MPSLSFSGAASEAFTPSELSDPARAGRRPSLERRSKHLRPALRLPLVLAVSVGGGTIACGARRCQVR